MTNKLEINDLECIRNEKSIFQNLTFKVESSQTILITGKNGSGKTSLLRIIAGFIVNYKGEILFNSKKINDFNKLIADFKFVGQKNSLKENLTVQQNIELWQYLYQTTIDIDQITGPLNIKSFLDKDVSSLSDGQRKRVSLSRLTISQSKVWLLDEPLVYLDADKVKLLGSLIDKHNKDGGMTIYSSNTKNNLDYNKLINMDDYALL
jgi:heme exporter protein A|tara:strand:- start:214 stop:834 length:621 start_codon:yes stop_codon:yes gene_type:complete